MPNAPTHDFITLTTAAGADLAYFHYAPQTDPKLATIFTCAYVFAGYACAGDLDLNSKEYNRWGPFRFIWWPYRQFVPHRSWVSHGLIMGGVIRVTYLAVMLTLLLWGSLWLYGHVAPQVDPNTVTRAQWESLLGFTHAHPLWTGAFLAGFILAGTAHSVADFISTWFKRRF